MKKPLILLSPDGQDFADLMSLEKISEDKFRSTSMPCVGGPRVFDGKLYITTFGGHVYAQSAWAAAQTVGKGFVIHNISGYFISAGITAVPFIYTVTPLRTGKSFLTLTVHAHQPASPLPGNDAPCFTATISFKQPAPPSLSYQDTTTPNAAPPLARFADVLHATHPRDLPEKRYTDLYDVITDASATPHRSPTFPGIHWAQLPYAHNERVAAAVGGIPDPRPAARVSANAYTVMGSFGGGENVNLAVCAHLFASDRETIYLVARHLGVREEVGRPRGAVASVSHKVILHDLSWRGVGFPDGEERWFVQEVSTDRWADGRVVVHGKILDLETGAHVASTMQDGIMKADFGGDEAEVERVREGLERGVVVRRGEKEKAKM